MAEYVDRNAAIEAVIEVLPREARAYVERAIQNLPTAEIRGVVRCKDCKYNANRPRRYDDDGVDICFSWCEYLIKHGGYCSEGKE